MKKAAGIGLVCAALTTAAVHAQIRDIPPPLRDAVAAERAFAARAGVVGWKQAFLEYFADDATGFEKDKTVPAKDQLRPLPDPPRDLQLLWEPRFGDVAASGELAWLTGPSTTINPARNNGAPRYGNYASVWKKQPDGSFKVVLDVGISTPMAAPFGDGFTRSPDGGRYTGRDSRQAATDALKAADAAIDTAAVRSLAEAYEGRVGSAVRLHRNGAMPVVGAEAARQWLAMQRAWTAAAPRFAEVAESRDLGYTYGTYGQPATAAGGMPEEGFYARVWSRRADGSWAVVLDVLQPQ